MIISSPFLPVRAVPCGALATLLFVCAAPSFAEESLESDLTGVLVRVGSGVVAQHAASAVPLGPAVVVPDTVRKPLSAARQLARLAKLPCAMGTYYIVAKKWRDEIAVGSVGLQSPPAGVAVPEGTTLALWTFAKASPSQKVVAMPDLVGCDLEMARARLAKDDLPMLAVAGAEEPPPAAKVISQYPPAGRPIYEGTAVHLVVAPQ